MVPCSSNSALAGSRALPAHAQRDCLLIVRLVSGDRGVAYGDFFARSRLRPRAANARQLAMYLCHVLLGLTMTQVGHVFGRDRTTVAHACARIEDLRDDGRIDAEIQALEDRFHRQRGTARRMLAGAGEAVHAGF